jgi:hypothetical protein
MTEAAVALWAVVAPWLLSGLAVAGCALELRFRYHYGPPPFDDVLGPRSLEEAAVLPRGLEAGGLATPRAGLGAPAIHRGRVTPGIPIDFTSSHHPAGRVRP